MYRLLAEGGVFMLLEMTENFVVPVFRISEIQEWQ
jgi:hypothetical protein